MQAIVGALRVILGLDSAAFERGVKNVQRQSQALERTIQGIDAKIGKLGNMAKAGFVGAGVGVALDQLKQAFATLGNIADSAANLGLSTDEFQKLQFAFQASAVSANEFSAGMERFVDAAGAALQGSGKLKEIFDRYKVSLVTANGEQKSTNELLQDFAEIINNAASAQEQMNLVRDVFGKNGAKYLEALRTGKQGLNEFAQAAVDAFFVIDKATLEAADKFDTYWELATNAASKNLKAFAVNAVEYSIQAYQAMFPAAPPSVSARDTDLIGYKPTFKTGGFIGDQSYIMNWQEKNKKPIEEIQGALNDFDGSLNASTDAGGKKFAKLQDRIGETTTVIEKVEADQSALTYAMEDFGYTVGDAFDRLVMGGEKLGDVLKGVARQLASSAIRDAFMMMARPQQAGGGGFFQGLVGAFAGMFADGGVIPRGQFGLVGERGPELVAAGSSPLTVYPNEAFGSGGGTVYNIDARGSNLSEAQFRAILADHQRQTLAMVPATVRGARQRGMI